ncbi:hypothetical protein O0L34_g8649 [Tuta absoluta]|nr:hypothetical protein O0L34_g8649 [Tuta absoluta]
MNVPAENIIVNSCDYTPIYLIPSTSVTQAGSYIITQSNQDARKPVADNLKTYYENSGNLESGILSSPKPRILKKQSASVVGNNLKLASFLLPKSESINVASIANLATVQPQPQPIVQPKQPIPALNNVIVKPPPPVTTMPTITNNVIDSSLPRVEIDRKIVRVGAIPATRKHYPRVMPKNKPRIVAEPKELKEIKIKEDKALIDPNLSKHTSVQLIKLGETYHSLNQLSDEQMKIVNKALKMFSDPEKIPKEPAYDPVTNTKFIYKVVSPRDLTVVGRNKHVVMKKKSEVKKQKLIVDEEPQELTPVVEAVPKTTRSGRTVKLPKAMRPSDAPHRPKKKVGNVVNCFQCSAEFCSLYRLQRHYEQYPTHIPARIHTDLFHCLLAILKGGSEEDQANMFIQQIEQLIEKIRTVLPCVLSPAHRPSNTKPTTINDDIGRLFGLSAGKYYLNMSAMCCIKNKEGHCVHNPPQHKPAPTPAPHPANPDIKPAQIFLHNHNEEIPNEAETEDCARIHSVDTWPNVTKRIWKLKQQKQVNAKKMRLVSEDQPIELGTEDIVTFNTCNDNGAIKPTQHNGAAKPDGSQNGAAKPDGSLELNKPNGSLELKEEVLEIVQQEVIEEPSAIEREQAEKPKTHAQFHSAHFDIRSSPIKLPSSLVRKFQFNPDKLTNFEVQILRPLEVTEPNQDMQPEQSPSGDNIQENNEMQTDTETDTDLQNTDIQALLRDNVELPKDTEVNNEISFDTPKSWHITESNDSSDDSFLKSTLFSTGLTPVKSASLESSLLHMNDKQILFETPSKPNDMIEAHILEIVTKSNSLIEPSLLHVPVNTNGLFDSNQPAHRKEQHNGFFESSMHVKPKCNTLIGSSVIQMKDKTFESALSHVKERSNNLFDEAMLQSDNKSNSLDGKDSLFDTGMSDVKDRPTSLFESSLLDMKDKDSLLDSSLLQDDNSNLFNPSLSHGKHDGLLQQPLVHENTNGINGTSLLHDKGSGRNSVTIEDIQVNLSTSDRVLNFLDSLGNESLGLSYPETEIRNTSVDFQLDLFSFSNS